MCDVVKYTGGCVSYVGVDVVCDVCGVVLCT